MKLATSFDASKQRQIITNLIPVSPDDQQYRLNLQLFTSKRLFTGILQKEILRGKYLLPKLSAHSKTI